MVDATTLRFIQGTTRYLLYRKLGGLQGRSGRVLVNLPPPEFEPWAVHLVVSRCTDYDIPTHTSGMRCFPFGHHNIVAKYLKEIQQTKTEQQLNYVVETRDFQISFHLQL